MRWWAAMWLFLPSKSQSLSGVRSWSWALPGPRMTSWSGGQSESYSTPRHSWRTGPGSRSRGRQGALLLAALLFPAVAAALEPEGSCKRGRENCCARVTTSSAIREIKLGRGPRVGAALAPGVNGARLLTGRRPGEKHQRAVVVLGPCAPRMADDGEPVTRVQLRVGRCSAGGEELDLTFPIFDEAGCPSERAAADLRMAIRPLVVEEEAEDSRLFLRAPASSSPLHSSRSQPGCWFCGKTLFCGREKPRPCRRPRGPVICERVPGGWRCG